VKPLLLFVAALVLGLARVLAPLVSFTTGGQSVTLGRAEGICTSGLGEWAQALSASAAADCGHVALVYDGLNVAVVAGVACVGWGMLLLAMRPGS
jgi:hypothetical protein